MSRWKTMFGIVDVNETPKLNKVCTDISFKDSTFSYRIVKPRTQELIKKFVSILIIYSNTNEMANKRGGWFLHKMKDAKVSNYFWVKMCKKECDKMKESNIEEHDNDEYENIKIRSEKLDIHLNEGTIIDIETSNFIDFRKSIYKPHDSRLYIGHISIFGYIKENTLIQIYATKPDIECIPSEIIIQHLNTIKRPNYSFNARFERGIIYNLTGTKDSIDYDISTGFEKGGKDRVAKELGFYDKYPDPYSYGYGTDKLPAVLCQEASKKGETENPLKHNRSCLLKERDILIKRGAQKPEQLFYNERV